ncbi:MAG: 3-phosphoshikimate 1-carboxyvinyltransferase [Bellilinea sp.]|nr:MAG: 3-phosphoshikimate 1-carboxyvinyltransferase [Bellilinea sp.]
MSRLTVFPGNPLCGEVHLPGDKSISHRAALLAAMADGHSRLYHFLDSGVTRALLNALQQLGVDWQIEGETLNVQGGPWRSPQQPLHCGNSATTLRLLAGALAARNTAAVLDGSAGLRRRPMGRILQPLCAMGVPIHSPDGEHAPLTLSRRPAGQPLFGTTHRLSVASAQVKSCLLLAGLAAESPVTVIEPHRSRDHSERLLKALGVKIESWTIEEGWGVTVQPHPAPLPAFHLTIPGDTSAAAFWVVAASITPASRITLRGVGLNPGRIGLLEALQEMGGRIEIIPQGEQGGEPVGDVIVTHGNLRGIEICGERVTAMIDEFPVFAVAAAFAQGMTRVREAEELRHKESDRIRALCSLLKALGADVVEHPDGFTIDGRGGLKGGAAVPAEGDHRIAMAAAVAGLAAAEPVTVQGAEIMAESYPDFAKTLQMLGGSIRMETNGGL